MSKRILVAPLDWGLGHATRCIPLIRHLKQTGNTPVIASSGRPLQLLRSEFPEVEVHEFEGYDISYPEGSGMVWKMFRSTPRILRRIREEEQQLKDMLSTLQLDAVISDNRFGLHTDRVPCVYMTHQVMIKAPFFETTLYRMHMGYMRKFHQVWVPDHATDGLSGDLAHKYPIPFNGRFIGPLSRFDAEPPYKGADVLVLISGPEPQRTRFESLVLEQAGHLECSVTAVVGTPDRQFDRKEGHLRVVSHLNARQLQHEMAGAGLIVSRSGYSTIMDLAAMGKKAVFVPTPGQTEQEYLAQLFHARGQHLSMTQRKFDLGKAVVQSQGFSGFQARGSDAYKQALDELISSLS